MVKALDANNQVVPANNATVTFTLAGPGAVVGENPLILEAGTGAVYVKSALGQTGTLTLGASSPGLTATPPASIATTAFTDPIVPTSGGYTFGFPVDVNDRVTGPGPNRFQYAGSGWRTAGDGQAFSKDNTFSGTAGDTATLTFTGNRVVLYGVLDPGHGSGAVSVDGGPEQTVSFQAATRRANVALWSSAALSQGNHTLRVRVAGNGPIALDRATVVSGAPAIVAAPAAAPTGHLIPRGQWSLRFVDSQELEGEVQLSGPAISAFDSSTRTHWHSRWQEATDLLPHEIQIDLGNTYHVSALLYTPRQDNPNGRIAQYEFYVSPDGTSWGSPVATGTFPNSTAQQTVTFTAKAGRYMRLRALSSLNGQPFTAIADLQMRGTPPDDGTVTIDDRVTGAGLNQFNYAGAWQSCTNCGAELYAGTNSWDNIANDQVTVTFTGTQIRFYGVRDPRHGIGMVSIDRGAETAVDFYNATRQGNQLMWSSPTLPAGTHTFRLRVTGTANPSASNTWVVPDRVDVIS